MARMGTAGDEARPRPGGRFEYPGLGAHTRTQEMDVGWARGPNEHQHLCAECHRVARFGLDESSTNRGRGQALPTDQQALDEMGRFHP